MKFHFRQFLARLQLILCPQNIFILFCKSLGHKALALLLDDDKSWFINSFPKFLSAPKLVSKMSISTCTCLYWISKNVTDWNNSGSLFYPICTYTIIMLLGRVVSILYYEGYSGKFDLADIIESVVEKSLYYQQNNLTKKRWTGSSTSCPRFLQPICWEFGANPNYPTCLNIHNPQLST